jgi:hypothetical protein
VLTDIQLVSVAKNSALDITGLLIATPNWFAQLLEGPPDNVDQVMVGILADPRHYDVRVVRRMMAMRRRCPRWRLARFDRGIFETRHMEPALASAHADKEKLSLRRLDRLIDRMLADLSRDAPSGTF